mmetsp:Transcript_16551/g.37324  ORF Transcript_16551/g.37324 Transcript_16551/m.37324 type:complete len:248 (-) Transcript_16551:52-795(-)
MGLPSAPPLLSAAAGEALESEEASGPAAADRERARSERAWADYQVFLADPGHRCPTCWLLRRFCCCAEIPSVQLRPRVLLLMHHVELSQRRTSNTAKVLMHFGAELFAWGVAEHDRQFSEEILADPGGTVVLFPAEGAVEAGSLTGGGGEAPRCIVVLDGGWRECKRMNSWIDPRIRRCIVTTASREVYGGTRKYGGDGAEGRVQTAAAFAALLRELGEEATHIAAMEHALACFLSRYEAQIKRSKT